MPSGVNRFTQIGAAGNPGTHCGIGDNGRAYCWGNNYSGQLGNGTSDSNSHPLPTEVSLPAGITVSQISVSRYGTCAKGSDGKAYCWGIASSNWPVAVSLPRGGSFSYVSIGCGLDNDGKLYCWNGGGDNIWQVTQVTPAPANLANFRFTQISSSYKACALGNDGNIYCWQNSCVNDGPRYSCTYSPQLVNLPAGVNRFTAVAASDSGTFAIADNGRGYSLGGGDAALNNSFDVKTNNMVALTLPVGTNGISQIITDDYYGFCALATGTGNGVCGSSAGICSVGRYNNDDNHTTTCGTNRTWSCAGINGGTTANCLIANAACQINGRCGSSVNTCNYGSPSNLGAGLSGSCSGIATWSCVGSNGGTTANCSQNNRCASCLSPCGTIAHGASCTAYATSSACSGSCRSETRTCNNGTLSGSFTNASCSIMACGTPYWWGLNYIGALGNGGTDNSYTTNIPQAVTLPSGVSSFSQIAGGGYFGNCAIGSDKQAYCWGGSTTPQLQRLPSTITQISNSGINNTTCAIGDDGNAYCWGNNTYGQFGDGTSSPWSGRGPSAVKLPANVNATNFRFTQISTSGYGACALGNNGNAYCWGRNGNGQLGNGTADISLTPVQVIFPAGVTGFTQISSGERNNCAIGNEGNAYCWGYNGFGELGDGTTTDRNTPQKVQLPSGVSSFSQISTSGETTCAIANDGNSYCWGLNQYGQLGNGTTDNYTKVAHPTPAKVSLPNNVGLTQISVISPNNGSAVCGLGNNGQAYCWGNNNRSGGSIHSSTPMQMPVPSGFSSFSQISINTFASCGIASNATNGVCSATAGACTTGTVTGDNGLTSCGTTRSWSCTGANGGTTASCSSNNGVCGPAVNGACSATLGACSAGIVTGDNGLTSCGTTRSWSCAGTNGGTTASCTSNNGVCGNVYCWGDNSDGMLGNGSYNQSSIRPVAVTMPAGVSSFTQISEGYSHTCGIGNDSRAYCWGKNSSGQLGNGTNTSSITPVAVTLPAGVSVTQVTSGGDNTCAIDNNGRAYCWGYNYYLQLGDGTRTDRSTPVAIPLPSGVTSFSQITTSGNNTCAIGNNRITYCWGWSPALQPPAGVSRFTQITTGAWGNNYPTTCGIGNDGNAYCWGYGSEGQLGNGTTNYITNNPVAITMPTGVSSFTQISLRHTNCGIGNNGKAYCWGNNTYGTLGDGTTTNRSTPVAVINLPVGVSLTQISAGYKTTCAIGNNGKAYCWGDNSWAQLGDGTTNNSSTPVPVTMPAGVSTFSQITTGAGTTCAIAN